VGEDISLKSSAGGGSRHVTFFGFLLSLLNSVSSVSLTLIAKCAYSFRKYLFETHYVIGTILGTGDKAVKTTDKNLS